MPSITINGRVFEFTPGARILQIALDNGVEIPHYCYHPGLSVPAQCRICLAEVWAPNPRSDNKLEPFMGGKLLPTCQQEAADGMVVYTDSPKAMANQKAVMEYLLINHPLDCPVCDQAGECTLQDFSYRYGRSSSRFEETKLKQPKKDVGEHVLLYSDRCILCTRCVRFTEEITGTGELYVDGRGNKNQIEVFPGVGIDNELSGNVIDLCPVGALLDKDFLFTQRVWFLKKTPSIDGITASGDNIFVEHNEGKVYRVKPRENPKVNRWWITDEVRYGWKFVHSDDRLTKPTSKRYGVPTDAGWVGAYKRVMELLPEAATKGPTALVVSPMLTCEDAYLLAKAFRRMAPEIELVVGPVPFDGEDRVYPPGADADSPGAYRVYAEKAPNARGVRRVLEGVFGGDAKGKVKSFDDIGPELEKYAGVVMTGNYTSRWPTDELVTALGGRLLVLIDTLDTALVDLAEVVLPGATWVEKAGTFENARGVLQSFERAIPPVPESKAEAQIAMDLLALLDGDDLDRHMPRYGVLVVDEQPGQVPASSSASNIIRGPLYNPAETRREMADLHERLGVMLTEVGGGAAAEPAAKPAATLVEL